MHIKVVDLTRELVAASDPHIRMADRMEWLAGIGQDVVPALLASPWGFARCAVDGSGFPLCYWGVDASSGEVWLVATAQAERVALLIHRELRPEFQKVLDLHPRPHCYADSRNSLHHRWLIWLGFERAEEVRYGPLQMPFIHFRYKE